MENPTTEEKTDQTQQETGGSTQEGDTAEKTGEPEQETIDLTGLWHLDGERNDLTAFEDRFPGYGEWGASLELGSDGQVSWYIGAESWHGTYTLEDGALRGQMTSDLDQTQRSWDFRVVPEGEGATLEMTYEEMTVCWAAGEQENPARGADGE